MAMVAPDKFALIVRWSDELAPEEIADRYMSDADLVLCEGFKGSALPKIEIFRREAQPSPSGIRNRRRRRPGARWSPMPMTSTRRCLSFD